MNNRMYDDIIGIISLLIITFFITYLINNNNSYIITIINIIKSSSLYKIMKTCYHYSSYNKHNNNNDNNNDIKYITELNYPITNINKNYYNNDINNKTFDINNKDDYDIYINKQNECTETYINSNMNDDEEFFDKLLNDIDYEDIIAPYQAGKMFFYLKRNSLNSSYYLYKSDNLNEESELLIQPPDDMIISMVWTSPNGKWVAYALTMIDNDNNTMIIKVRDVDTCIDSEADTIICNDMDFFSLAWYENHAGFFYVSKSPTSNNVGIFYHTLGTLPTNDILTYDPSRGINNNNDDAKEEDDTLLTFDIKVTADYHYLVIEVFRRDDAKFIHMVESSTKFGDITSCAGNAIRIIDLSNFSNTLKPGLCAHLITSFSNRFQFVSNIEEDFWFRTNFNAPNYRIVRLNLPSVIATVLTDDNRYQPIIISTSYINNNIREWIAESSNGILQSASIAALTVLVLKYFKDCSNEILIYDLSQSLDTMPDAPAANLPHPSFGTLYHPIGCSFFSYNIFYKFSDFSHPCSIYRAQIRRDDSGNIEISFAELYAVTVPGIDPYELETKQENIMSFDGTKIPIYIFGTKKLHNSDESQAVALYSHGCFGISLQPEFSLIILLYAYYCNAYFVVVNARGGGEKGSEWHNKAKKVDKRKTAEDILGATDFLIENEYADKSKIIVIAEGAGALITAGLLSRMPWKYKAAVFSQGLFDVTSTITDSLWADEFGSINITEESKYVKDSSPMKVRKDDLLLVHPSTLLLVNKNHSSISPLDSYRYIETLRSSVVSIEETLQQNNNDKKPHLIFTSDDQHLNELYFLTFLHQQTTK